MKRCPKCEFLYEDYERLCDMDGTALVHDAHALPDSRALPHWTTGRAWPFLVAVVVGSVLAGMTLYEFNSQTRFKRVDLSAATSKKVKPHRISLGRIRTSLPVNSESTLQSSAVLNGTAGKPDRALIEPGPFSSSTRFRSKSYNQFEKRDLRVGSYDQNGRRSQ